MTRSQFSPQEAAALHVSLTVDLTEVYSKARSSVQAAWEAITAEPLGFAIALESLDPQAAKDLAGALQRLIARADELRETVASVAERTRDGIRQERTRLAGHVALAKADIADLERTRQTVVDELRRHQRPFPANANDALNARLAEIDARRANLTRFIETLDASLLPFDFEQRVQARATHTTTGANP